MRDGRFVTPDGVAIHYVDYRPETETGAPVLCLHGLTRNVRDFEELAPRITELGRRVIVPSQRGRGLSDPDPDPSRYTPAVYVGDMFGLLDHLAIASAVFVGTSMGGLMTMVAAATAPGRVAAAVINDVGPELDPVGMARIRGYAGLPRTAGDLDGAVRLCRDLNGSAFPKETGRTFWERFTRRLFRDLPDGSYALDYDPRIAEAVAAGGASPDLWPLFDALRTIPTLLVRGAISDVLMTSTVEEMCRRHPSLGVCEAPDVGHAPFLTEPEAWSALSDFLLRDSR